MGQIAALVAAESGPHAPGKDGIQMAIGPDPVLLPDELAVLAPGLEGVATLAPAFSVKPLGFAV